MKTLYNLTFITASGARAMVGARQGRHMKATREEAESYLAEFLKNNSEERLVSVYGKASIGSFRVDPFECFDHGDPIRSIAPDETFIVSGYGRKVGAIGIRTAFSCEVEAQDAEDARIRVYDQYEHITDMRVVPKT